MKKQLLFLFILLCSVAGKVYAQVPPAAAYTFAASSAPYAYLTGGTAVSGIYCDDCGTANIPLNFNFVFCGNSYSQVSVASNGLMQLNNAGASSRFNDVATLGAQAPQLMPMWDDLFGGSTPTPAVSANYLTTGSAPNRVFVFEWREWRSYGNRASTAGAGFSMQVKLYEGTNRIQFHYKREAVAGLDGATIGIGQSGTDYQILPNTGAAPVPITTGWVDNLTTLPATDQVYQWDPPYCAPVTNILLTAFNSKSASFTWTGVTGTTGYTYAVDEESGAAPAAISTRYNTTNTNGSVTGLKPNTLYYIHVRNNCSALNISNWEVIAFTTLPECSVPGKIAITAIDSSSVTYNWPGVATATTYQYVVNDTRTDPTTGATLTTQPANLVSLTGLAHSTWYYVHTRSICPSDDTSAWALDSFRTPFPCRKPELRGSYISANNSLTNWDAIPTAIHYEYYLGPVSSLPNNGTPIVAKYIQTPYLQANSPYTVSVKAVCLDYGISTKSDWASLDLTTLPPLGVSNVTTGAATLDVYPNPVKNILNIKVGTAPANGATAVITDVNGKVTGSYNISDADTQVDVSLLPAGMYMLKYTDQNQTRIIKFSKQ